jgi:hypothetical protein
MPGARQRQQRRSHLGIVRWQSSKGEPQQVSAIPIRRTRKVPAVLWLGLLACIMSSTLNAYEALQGPTELLYWDKTDSYSGLTWFGVRGTTYLLDMEGCVVHT